MASCKGLGAKVNVLSTLLWWSKDGDDDDDLFDMDETGEW